MPIDPTKQFPSAAPIWGFGENLLITDVISQSYKTDQTDANVYAITPSDSTILSETVSRLELGTAGDVALVTDAGGAITFHTLAAGQIHTFPFRIKQIKATGTTATNITGIAG